MQSTAKFIIFLVLSNVFFSCNKPDYSNVPSIELLSLTQNKLDNANQLVFEFKFKDGDADLGLNEDDKPTTSYVDVFDSNGNLIFFDILDLNAKFSCKEWNPVTITKIREIDEFNNLLISIDVKRGNRYEEVDNSCEPLLYRYRFGRLNPKNYTGPLDVKFTYFIDYTLPKIPSFERDTLALRNEVIGLVDKDFIRFRVRIRDRAGNLSNEVVSKDIQIGLED